MQLKTPSYIVLLFPLFLVSCDHNPVDFKNKQPALYLKVVDPNSNSIADVGFHYIFYDNLNYVMRTATIQYPMPASDTVTLKVFDPFQQEVVTLLDKVYQRAGMYSYYYDASGVTNAIYQYQLSTSSSTISGKFIIRTDDLPQLSLIPPLAKTDQNGQMQISYGALGIGYHFNYQAGNTPIDLVISDSITVLLVKQGYNDFSRTFRIDTTKATELTFTMLPK